MAKKAQPLKRYIYISQRKIEIFEQQQQGIPIVSGLAEWFTKAERIKIKDIEIQKPPSTVQHSKLIKIVERLKKENTFGTVDKPAEYIQDVLPLFYRLIPSRPGYRRSNDDPGFVYFGGGTPNTAIALVGSPFHLLLGRSKEISETASSDLPLLVAYINDRLGEIIEERFQARIKRNHPSYGIGAIQQAEQLNKDPRIPMEFLACRILDSAQMNGLTPRKRLLLYTPLYVAHASDV